MREQPCDRAAEDYIIACSLTNSEYIGEISKIIDISDFYQTYNATIFEVCKQLYTDGIVVDIISVNDKLAGNKIYIDGGGIKKLMQLVNDLQTTAGYRHHAEIIREKSLLRSTIKISLGAINDAQDKVLSAKEIIEETQQKLFNVASANIKQSLTQITHDVCDALRTIEALQCNINLPGLSTGFTDLDKKTGGLQKGEFIIIAGRPSMGKTAFALNIAENVAKQKKGVAIFSLEMSRRLLINRLISSASNISANKIKYGNLAADDWPHLSNGAEKLASLPLFVDDSVDLTAFDIRVRSRNIANQLRAKGQTLDLIVIDYLQLLKGDPKLFKDKNIQVADISRQIKSLARDLDVPVVALSQLSRATEQRGIKNSKPVLSDLRDSGAIEQDADIVMFVWREGYYERNDPTKAKNATIIVGKNRNGGTGEVQMIFEAELTKFFDKVND